MFDKEKRERLQDLLTYPVSQNVNTCISNSIRTDEVTFDNFYGIMPLEGCVKSIFDSTVAGQIDTRGVYYNVCLDYKTKEFYAVTPETYAESYSKGRPLKEDEEAIFCGERVRGMSVAEQELYNGDMLSVPVDLWGNISAE